MRAGGKWASEMNKEILSDIMVIFIGTLPLMVIMGGAIYGLTESKLKACFGGLTAWVVLALLVCCGMF